MAIYSVPVLSQGRFLIANMMKKEEKKGKNKRRKGKIRKYGRKWEMEKY